MAYFGKEFIFEREENFDKFVKAISSPEENTEEYIKDKPNQIIEKTGDSYKLTLKGTETKQELVFKSGVPFTETVGAWKSKTTITVDGDTFTQVQDYGSEGTVTYKREFSADKLKITHSCSAWDGVAYRYYKA